MSILNVDLNSADKTTKTNLLVNKLIDTTYRSIESFCKEYIVHTLPFDIDVYFQKDNIHNVLRIKHGIQLPNNSLIDVVREQIGDGNYEHITSVCARYPRTQSIHIKNNIEDIEI